MRYLQHQAVARSTRRIYKTGWRAFRIFCAQHNVVSLPASKSTICLFATSVSRRVSPSTIRTYLAAVAYFHKSRGATDPTVNNCRLQLILRGIRRTGAEHPLKPARIRQPISLTMLRRLCKATYQLGLSQHNRAMFVSALTLAFHGCLRVSEFTHSKYAWWNPRIRDASISASSLVYHIRQSKTDQLARGTQVVISRARDHAVCPCRAMLTYLEQLKKPHPSLALFHWDNGSPLRRQGFVSLLKRSLQLCGYNPSRYNSHSLRVGAATHAAKQGLPEEAIRRLGRWRSSAYRRYVRL